MNIKKLNSIISVPTSAEQPLREKSVNNDLKTSTVRLASQPDSSTTSRDLEHRWESKIFISSSPKKLNMLTPRA